MGAKSDVTVGPSSGCNALPIFVDDCAAVEEVFDRLERTIESYYEGLESIDQYMRAGQENFHVVSIKMRNEQLWQSRCGLNLSFLESKQHNQVLHCQHNIG